MKVEFYIKSNRGTDNKTVVELPDDSSKAHIKSELEDWCSNFGAWHHSDNIVDYGYTILSRAKSKKNPKHGLL